MSPLSWDFTQCVRLKMWPQTAVVSILCLECDTNYWQALWSDNPPRFGAGSDKPPSPMAP